MIPSGSCLFSKAYIIMPIRVKYPYLWWVSEENFWFRFFRRRAFYALLSWPSQTCERFCIIWRNHGGIQVNVLGHRLNQKLRLLLNRWRRGGANHPPLCSLKFEQEFAILFCWISSSSSKKYPEKITTSRELHLLKWSDRPQICTKRQGQSPLFWSRYFDFPAELYGNVKQE